MLGGLVRFVLFRLLGARVLLVLTVLGWLRNRLWRKPPDARDRDTARDRDAGTGSTPRRVG